MNPSVNFFLFCTFNRRHSGLRDYNNKTWEPNQTLQLVKIPCTKSSNRLAIAHSECTDKVALVSQATFLFRIMSTDLDTVLRIILGAFLGTVLH